jgi:uncharacterized membrane protein (DUF4010 family)
MDTFELFQRLSVALAIGLVIGLERGWSSRTEVEGERAAGLRTHALAGLLGGVWGAIAAQTRDSGGAVALGLGFVAFAAAIVVFRFREVIHEGTYGATTVVAAMLAFGLGAFAVLGNVQVAAAGGVAVAALLALKALLHAWVERITWEELRSGIVLLAMTFILLPLLPDRTVDPWDALNPHALWLMTILIAALSFAGYVAIKMTGEGRGIILTGFAGGLVSSTAVTLSLARLAREAPNRVGLLVAGMAAASATMTVRVLIIVGLLNWEAFQRTLAPLATAGALFAILSFGLTRRAQSRDSGESGLDVRNPFDLVTVLKFGALLTAITFAAKFATGLAGHAGAYTLSALSGLAEVDAITLSMARLGGSTISSTTAANAILLAVAVNAFAKVALGWYSGGARLGRWLLLQSVLAVVAGLVAFLAVGRG